MTTPGLEKFANLEDKLHRVVELCKKLKQEKEQLRSELEALRLEVGALTNEKAQMDDRISKLLEDRKLMREKVEGMLDAIATLELEAESLKK
ncbi:MAG: hypothetical protein IPM66_01125 [Acidobacteriota bacterium]|nr:MAG: hypothetical protein IPM66_01125 [Acidobacteriota bacterium]